MADVFISYSRRDGEFVQRLNTAFVGANRVVWVDWQSIPRGEDWWREIQHGIEGADAFVCVVSEHWLTSEICHNELLHARHKEKWGGTFVLKSGDIIGGLKELKPGEKWERIVANVNAGSAPFPEDLGAVVQKVPLPDVGECELFVQSFDELLALMAKAETVPAGT